MKTRNQNIAAVALSFVSAIGVMACAKQVETAKESISQQVRNVPISHTWTEVGCRHGFIVGWGNSQRTRYEISGEELKKFDLYFSDDSCQNVAVTVQFNGVAHAGNEISPNIRELDITLKTATVTVNDATARGLLNLSHACGKSDWAIDQTIDVTGSSSD